MPGSRDSRARRKTSDRTSMQKAGLQHRAAGPALRRGRGERRGEGALARALHGLLQDGVDDEVGRRLSGRGVGGRAGRPALRDRLSVAGEQGLVEDHPDGEEVPQRPVGGSGQLRLPQPVAGDLGPAAERQQHLVEVALQGLRPEAEPRDRAGQGRQRPVRHLRDVPRKAAQAGDLRGEVVDGPGAPERERAPAGLRRPQGLPLVEVADRPGRDPVGDQRPGQSIPDASAQREARVGTAGAGGASARIAALRASRPAGREAAGASARASRRSASVRSPEAALSRYQPRGNRHRRAARPGETCARGPERLAGMPEEGVDRDAGGERPQGRVSRPAASAAALTVSCAVGREWTISIMVASPGGSGGVTGGPAADQPDRGRHWRRVRWRGAPAGRRRRVVGPEREHRLQDRDDPKLRSASTISAHSSGPGAGVGGSTPAVRRIARDCRAK